MVVTIQADSAQEFKVKLGDRWTRDVGFVPGAELDADGSDDEAMDE